MCVKSLALAPEIKPPWDWACVSPGMARAGCRVPFSPSLWLALSLSLLPASLLILANVARSNPALLSLSSLVSGITCSVFLPSHYLRSSSLLRLAFFNSDFCSTLLYFFFSSCCHLSFWCLGLFSTSRRLQHHILSPKNPNPIFVFFVSPTFRRNSLPFSLSLSQSPFLCSAPLYGIDRRNLVQQFCDPLPPSNMMT